jgi:hypothetical protein
MDIDGSGSPAIAAREVDRGTIVYGIFMRRFIPVFLMFSR